MPCHDYQTTPNMEAERRKINELTDLLCEATALLEEYEVEQLSPKLAAWRDQHKELETANIKETIDNLTPLQLRDLVRFLDTL